MDVTPDPVEVAHDAVFGVPFWLVTAGRSRDWVTERIVQAALDALGYAALVAERDRLRAVADALTSIMGRHPRRDWGGGGLTLDNEQLRSIQTPLAKYLAALSDEGEVT